MSEDIVIVTGAIVARPETFEELRRLSLEHVRRSRAEPGCIAHGVAVDCENRLRLVFHEEWTDEAALLAHFAVDASRRFAGDAARLGAEPPTIAIYRSGRSKLMARF